MIYNIVQMADIHIGRNGYSAKKYYFNELKPMLKDIRELTNLHLIILAGDISDKPMLLNSEAAVYYQRFFSDLVSIAEEKEIPIRIVSGTPSHEARQLESVRHYEDTAYDFKIINTATAEEVLPDYKALFLPHENVDNPILFYQPLFNDYYDACILHGTIEGVLPYVNNQRENGIHHNHKAYVFPVDLLSNAAIYTSAGHIHTRTKMCDNVWYIGATTTLTQADNNLKGFEVVMFDTIMKKFNVTHFANTNARKFKTYILSDILNNTVEDELYDLMENAMNEENVILRFKINRNALDDRGLSNLNYVRTMFNDANLEVKSEITIEDAKQIEADIEKANLVLDESTPIEDIILQHIKDNNTDGDYIPTKEEIAEFIGINENPDTM